MSEDKRKKERSTNFTANEIDLLANIVIKHAAIIESKKTDATTWKEKKNEWEKVAEEFNSVSPHCPRSTISLQTKYNAMKKELKKKYSAHRQDLYRTGGGNYTKVEFTPTEERFLSLLSASVEGLPPRSDCDQTRTTSEGVLTGRTCLFNITTENIDKVYPIEDSVITLLPDSEDNDAVEEEMQPQIIVAEPGPSNWAKWTPIDLKKPLSDKLQTPSRKRKLTESKNDAIEKVSKLSTSKLELIQLQKKSIEMDIEIKKEKGNIELEILKVELETKRVDLQIKLLHLEKLNKQ